MFNIISKNNLEKTILKYLLVAVVVLSIFYIYFINQSIFNINNRRLSENKINILEGKIATLEANYIALSSDKINTEYARSLGFKDTDQKSSLVVRKMSGVNLSMNTNEI